MKKSYLILLFFLLSFNASAQFSISGKLRTLQPMTLKVEDLNGKMIVQCDIKSNEPFKTKKVDLVPDLYKLTIGERVDMVILNNHEVTIKGYLNDKNLPSSNVIFGGMEQDAECKAFKEEFNSKNNNDVAFLFKNKDANPLFLATTVYSYHHLINVYEDWKGIADLMPTDNKSLICDYIRKGAAEREIYRIGGEAFPFKAEDKDGTIISLSDFRGKFVLVDFWASWCGPCLKEMQNIKNIFNELKCDDIQFISISLDDSKDKWFKAMEEEQIPWLSLWDKAGFYKTILQSKYGFNTIPFIVFIDKEGKTVARYLRGKEIETIIRKALDNKL